MLARLKAQEVLQDSAGTTRSNNAEAAVVTANDIFTRGFNRLSKGWVNIRAFREVAEIGLPLAAPQVTGKNQQIARYLMDRPDWASFLKNDDEFQKLGGSDAMASLMTTFSLKSAKASVDAASIVFAHSVVDAVLMDFLCATSIASPADWEQFLDEKKQWRVLDVRQLGYERLFQDLLSIELRRMERNCSLPKKADRLLDLCRPERGWRLPMQYDQKEQDELKRIDGLRHAIVHGDLLGEIVPTLETDLKFLENIGQYFFVLVHNRYSMKIIA
jgi:hypothetical protein